jgi:hypothetical protein
MVSTRFLGVAFVGLAAAASLSPDSWAQTVLVVDKAAGPGSSFMEIQPAVDIAADGDTILVRSGTYKGFTITNKGIAVVADTNAQVAFAPLSVASVQTCANYQAVALRGLHGALRLTASNLAGPLWIEDCDFVDFSFGSTLSGIEVTSCASVVIHRTNARGLKGFGFLDLTPGMGLSSKQSNVFAFDSTFQGSDGFWIGMWGFGTMGGAGASFDGGSIYAAGSTFKGGQGGSAPQSGPPKPGGNGGPGLSGTASAVGSTLDCQFIGGPAGFGTAPGGQPGPPLAFGGQLTQIPGLAYHYSVASPIREQQLLRFHFDGAAAADVYLFVGVDPGLSIYIPGVWGPLFLDLVGIQIVPLGSLPAGASSVAFPVGNLPPTVSAFELWTQPLFTDPTFSFLQIGPPSEVTVLDSSF